MKRTGRRLTLSNDINLVDPASDTIFSTDYRLTTIFSDDRENYGWKIVDIKQFDPIGPTYERASNWALMSVRPDSFAEAVVFQVWAQNAQPFDNSLIGTYNSGISDPYSLRTEHVATNHLSLFYVNGNLPYYNITLEEYEITSREEIMFKIKETSQSLSDIE
jgi:hypothetical protein